ncbi:MAG: hypothetical protein ACRD5F_07195 [Candidatus Acidiferrales bacterium]
MVAVQSSATTAQPAFGEARLPSGVRLHYAGQGPRKGEAVVMLRGWSDS